MHKMKLQQEYFNYIKYGTKKYEIRLNDEKRRKIKKSDFIEFQREPDREEKIILKVEDIKQFKNFKNLLDEIDIKYLSSKEMTKQNLLETLNKFYPEEKQKDGVLAIELNKDIIACKTKIKNIGLDNKIFEKLKENYQDFDKWLIKIENEDCFYTEKDGKVSSILILKVDEKDSAQFFEKGKILKIRTLVVDDISKGIGTFYMNIVDDIARENEVKYIYLTVKTENEKFIRFAEKSNYKKYSKIQDKFVYYKKLQ